jgi:hypothetical protein
MVTKVKRYGTHDRIGERRAELDNWNMGALSLIFSRVDVCRWLNFETIQNVVRDNS